MQNKSIGVYDSGIGGKNTLNAIRALLPEYDYVYLADSKNLPYGDKSPQELERFATRAIDRLFDKGCQEVVVACNSVCTSVDLAKYGNRVFGITDKIISAMIGKKTLTLATTRSADSRIFPGKVVACPLLVPIVESGAENQPKTEEILRNYLGDVGKVESIVLGCTHYNNLRNVIRKIVGENIEIISDIDVVPSAFKAFLEEYNDIEGVLSRNSSVRFLEIV